MPLGLDGSLEVGVLMGAMVAGRRSQRSADARSVPRWRKAYSGDPPSAVDASVMTTRWA